MNFFEEQERARAASRWLVLWFALCVAVVVAAVYAVAVVARGWLGYGDGFPTGAAGWWDPAFFAAVATATAGVVVVGSLFKIARLSAGGAVVARDMRGREVDPATSDLLERRLLNVVEEMSLAAGVPVPGVWVLDDEPGINAFAAGNDPADAVLGFTRGCVERLDRSELQAVAAHEFSHLLNGDMRLNMRLTGWIFGLVMVAMLGRFIFLAAGAASGSRGSVGGGGGGRANPILAAAGGAVWAAGSLGALMARWLQCGVSRRRELLADAAAVQFTRDPGALATALRKIGGHWFHGAMCAPAAVEARHVFFARSEMLEAGFSTHPPLAERIRALDPAWDGGMLSSRIDRPLRTRRGGGRRGRAADDWAQGLAGLVPAGGGPATAPGAEGAADDAGGALERILAGGGGVGSKEEAKAMLYGLLLSGEGREPDADRELVADREGAETASLAGEFAGILADRPAAERIALVDLSLPWLRRMGREEAAAFIATAKVLVQGGGEPDLPGFLLEKVIERHVSVGLGLRAAPAVRHRSLAPLEREAAVLVGAFAALDGREGADLEAREEFRQHTGRDLPRLPPEECTLEEVAKALPEIEAATPLMKSRILRLCWLVVRADGVCEEDEAQLLRAVSEAVGAPAPRAAGFFLPESGGTARAGAGLAIP